MIAPLQTAEDGHGPVLDLIVDDPAWGDDARLHDLAARAISAAVAFLDEDCADESVSLLFTSDAAIAELNARHRGKPKATNVLSFPAPDMPLPPGELRPIGDIALAYGTVRAEADLEGKPFDHHVTHLIVHGFLHLLGFDHVDDAMAEEMESAERAILKSLDIADPYA